MAGRVLRGRVTAGRWAGAHAGLNPIATKEERPEQEAETRRYFEAGSEGRRADIR